MNVLETKTLVIGSGLAGMMTAWRLRRHGPVLLATKKSVEDCASAWAQGGVACVMSPVDSVESHIRDTIETGGGLGRVDTIRKIVTGARAGIRLLEDMGLRFSQREGYGEEYDLGKEGGHSRRRVLHAGDFTGREIMRVLIDRVRRESSIELRENLMGIDLITRSWLGLTGEDRCVGAYFLDRESGEILAVRAENTVLAAGGAGKIYLYTSNPDTATGDGVAMAWRRGLPVSNMEFVQFHPTCLYHPEAKSFLISEALRGEGGRLINAAGESFTERFDPRGSLAPRDIVARAIDHEMKTRGDPCVYLDITHRSVRFLHKRFPNIYRTCLEYGIDIAHEPIPVVPAAHYFCGGVQAEVDGTTAIAGLRVIGENACTGLHGANRLASNSLLEALVSAGEAAEAILQTPSRPAESVQIPDWMTGGAAPSDEAVVVEHNWNEVRTCMWDYVGIVRTDKRLERAQRRIQNLRREIRQYYFEYLVTPDILELRNIADVAELVIRSARSRRESRGLHYTLDYPDRNGDGCARETVLRDGPGGPLAPPDGVI
jgi:L-aspartate oxidase